jgi:FKBP-type peptidyl-prolyl cis-trans isomerase
MALEKNRARRDASPISGLTIEETKLGTGVVARRGDNVTVRSSGTLNRGEVFQADVTVTFTLGKREAIAGPRTRRGSMKVGGLRKLRISRHLAYRDNECPVLFRQTPSWCSKSSFFRSADHSPKRSVPAHAVGSNVFLIFAEINNELLGSESVQHWA